jgi:hypothetical protein
MSKASLTSVRSALLCALIYALIAGGLFVASRFFLFPDGSPGQVLKGRVIVEQLAVAPAMLPLMATGLIDPLTEAFPWTNSYPVFFVLSVAIMFIIGWSVSAIAYLLDVKPVKRDEAP